MMVEAGGCSRGFEKFESVLAPMERRITVGQSTWRAYPAKEAVAAAGQVILDDPFITHCGNDECRRCRDAVLGGLVFIGL